MEKSLVRQFTGFGTQANTFFATTTKNGFIRTFKDQTDLGKSRIQNLPSYKKDDLSKRVQMVVVFQAIQISRLSVQIQSLRVQLKDSERQLQNYLSYQIQIKQLNEQCLRQQEQNLLYKQQIQKMNMICQKLYSQLQEMHRKYDHVDPQLQEKLKAVVKENKGLEKQLEDLKKTFVEKTQEITKNNQKLKKKVTFQQNQIQKLSQDLKQSKQQVNQQLVNELTRLRQCQKDFNSKQKQLMKEVQEKSMMLHNLKAIVKDKMNQTERQKSKVKNLEGNFINRIGELQNVVKLYDARLKNEIQSMNKELQLVENKLVRKEQELNEMKNVYESKINQLERSNKEQNQKLILVERQNKDVKQQYRKLNIQTENLKRSLQQKINQLNELTKKLTSLQGQFNTQIHRLNQDKQIISGNIIVLMNQVDTKTQQLKELKTILITLKKQQQQTIAEKQKITESFKSTIQQMEMLYQQLDKGKTKQYEANSKIEELNGLVKRFENDRRLRDGQMKGLQSQLVKMDQYKSQLENQLTKLSGKIQAAQRKTLQMEKSHSLNLNKLKSDHQTQLKSQQQRFITQVESIKRSFQIQSRQKSALSQQLTQLRQFSESQSLSITQLTKNIEMSQKLLKQVKSQQEKNIKQNCDKMKSATSKTTQMFKIHQNWVTKIIQLQDLISLLENENLKLQSENKLLNFQMVETHKINSMHKRRDSRTSTDSTSLKSFINSSSALQQNNQKNSFLRKNHKDSIMSDMSQSQPSQRRIFAQLHNKV